MYPFALLLLLGRLLCLFVPSLQRFLITLFGSFDVAKIVGNLLVECPRPNLAFWTGGIPIRQRRFFCRITHESLQRNIASWILEVRVAGYQPCSAHYQPRNCSPID